MLRQKTVVHILDLSSRRLSRVVRALVESDAYREQVERTIIVGLADANCGCWFDVNRAGSNRVHYWREGGVSDRRYSAIFEGLEKKFGSQYVYGQVDGELNEEGTGRSVEFVLIDVRQVNIHPVNALKGWLFEEFGIESIRYEHENDYERLIRLAPAALGAIRALLKPSPANPPVIISHDMTGMPTALAAVLDPLVLFKTMYCAHRVPMVRTIVEGHPGHDLMYNTLRRWAREHDYYLSDLFGSQEFNYEYALIGAARFCDNIMAMSRRIKEGLHFLSPSLKEARIELMYHGVVVAPVSYEAKNQARQKVRQMALKRLGVCPDHIVTRRDHLDTANAIWRDFRVLAALNQELLDAGKTAVFVLTPPGGDGADRCMAGADALQSMSARQYWKEWFDQFNQRNTNIKIMIFDTGSLEDYERERVTAEDILLAGDIELSQNIYRPSCTRPLQTVAVGGLCVASDSCGLNDLLADIADRSEGGTRRFGPGRLTALDLVIRADYTREFSEVNDRAAIMQIGQAQRDQMEDEVARQVAQIIYERLPRSESELAERMEYGRELLQAVTWDAVCKRYFIPALEYAYTHHQFRSIA